MNVTRNKNVKDSSEMSGIILEIPEGPGRVANGEANTDAAGAKWPWEQGR